MGQSFWNAGFGAACKYNYRSLIYHCLGKSIDQFALDQGLAEAVARGDEPLVQLLMEKGAQLSGYEDCVECAFTSGNPAMIQLVSHLEDTHEYNYWNCAFAGVCTSGSEESMISIGKKATNYNSALNYSL